MQEDGIIDEHVRQVHNISGIEAMTPLQRIEVDTKVNFEIPDLLDLKVSGPDKRATKLTLYTLVVWPDTLSLKRITNALLTSSPADRRNF